MIECIGESLVYPIQKCRDDALRDDAVHGGI